MNISMRNVLGFALTALVAGCGSAGTGTADAAEAQVAADGTEATTASAQSTNLASVVFENVSSSDPAMAAQQLGTPTALWPSGCATRSKDPTNSHVAHVTFKDCTGPFGLVHIDGDEVVTFSAGANGGVHAAITGVNLTANGNPVTYSATADITFPSATTRSVVWRGSWTRVNDKGDTVAHTSDLTIAVDLTAGCRDANGTAQTTVGSREVDTNVTDYKLCRNAGGAEGCPSGSVVHTGKVSGKTVTIKFDGTDMAAVTGPKGNTFEVPLVCTAE